MYNNMYSWTLVPSTESANCHKYIDIILNARKVDTDTLNYLEGLVSSCQMRTCLRSLIQSGMKVVKKNPTNELGLSFLLEFIAGLKYAADDASVGKMKHIRNQYRAGTNDAAIHFLKRFAQTSLTNSAWKHKSTWFQLRVHCMDAYVISILLSETDRDVLYYAGLAHTRNIESFMIDANLATRIEDSHHSNHLVESVKKIASQGGIAHMRSLRFNKSQRIVVLVGEDHSLTRLSFAWELVQLLQSLCCRVSNTLFLIEKHISNERDKIQTELMCNQPKLAIHASRCNSFVDKHHEQCPNLEIRAVDNRHTDLGFLRIELFDIWDIDAEFRKVATHFLRCALQSLDEFCTTTLQIQ